MKNSTIQKYKPKIIPESPTWPMKIFPRRMNAMLAVVPAVLGKPEAVRGHFSTKTFNMTL